MTVYYFKGSPIIAPVSYETEEFGIANKKLNLKEDRISGASQRWLVSFGVLPTGNFDPLAYMMTGFSSPVTFFIPQPHYVVGNLSGSTTEACAIGASSIPITEAAYNAIQVGRFIKFNSHNKVYMVIDKSVTNTIGIYPTLFRSVPNGGQFQYGANVSFTGILSSDQVRGMTFNDGILEDYGTIKLVEDFL